MAQRVRVYVRDSDGTVIGEIDQITYLDFRIRLTDVGTWSLAIPGSLQGDETAQSELLQPGRGIIVVLDGEVFGSGQIVRPTRELLGQTYVEGVDDVDILLGTLAFPQAPSLGTSSDAYDERNGAAEDVATAYVSANCGDTADPTRQRLRCRASAGRGSTISEFARFDPVIDVARRALAVDGYGFRVKADLLDPGLPYFEIIEPRDQSAVVEFSTFRGTIIAPSERRDIRPEATTAIVGGGEEGTLRVFRTVTNVEQESLWGRRETFVDARDTTDTTVLDHRGAAEVEPEGPVLELTVQETVGTQWGDWILGDFVTGQLMGVAQSLCVTEVRLVFGGGVATPKLMPILTPSATVRSDQVSLLAERVRALETHL